MREFISAFALARAVMVVCFISLPLTFIANYILIYGKYGFPALGIAGIGYASAGVCWFMFFSLLFYCRKQSILKYYVSFQLSKPDLTQLKALWVVGSFSGVINILDMVTFLARGAIHGLFWSNYLAAFQLPCVVSIAFNLPMAISVVRCPWKWVTLTRQTIYQRKPDELFIWDYRRVW